MQAVPQTILPRGQLQTPSLFRHAFFCGTVLNFQSTEESTADVKKYGTEGPIGSSGPASTSNTVYLGLSLSLLARIDPVKFF